MLSIQAVLPELSPPVYCYKIVNDCYMNNDLELGN